MMSQSVTPEEQEFLIAGYVLCNLSPEESAILEQLMADNPEVQKQVEAMQQTIERTYVNNEVEPPKHLKASILNAVQTQAEISSEISVVTPQAVANKVTPINWWQKFSYAAAVLIAALGISNYATWQSLQTLRAQIQPLETVQFTLEPTADNLNSSVNVTIAPENLNGTISVENLPPLAEDQIYALWTVVEANAPATADAKNAILTTVFTVDEQGNLSQEIIMPSIFRERKWVKAIAITVENREAPQRHLAKPILIQTL